jgi:acyl-coenzyme A synthetase/AMP-(fatty) acid ligase
MAGHLGVRDCCLRTYGCNSVTAQPSRRREIVRGLICIGDVGHFDGSGLLFVEGRDDDVIVSGQ